jgi:hypothetical protein
MTPRHRLPYRSGPWSAAVGVALLLAMAVLLGPPAQARSATAVSIHAYDPPPTSTTPIIKVDAGAAGGTARSTGPARGVAVAFQLVVATEDTTTLYRVQPLSNASDELENGLDPADFSEGDQSAHFGNEERTEDFYNNHSDTHGNGYQVEVPNSWLENNNIETWEGTGNELEYPIPRQLFGEFNQFPRAPWAPGAS